MVETVAALNWQPFPGNSRVYVAPYVLNGALETNYVFTTAKIVTGNIAPSSAIDAVWITIDNSQNENTVSIAYANVAWFVDPFARQSFKLPSTQVNVALVTTGGLTNVFFSNVQLVNDDVNRFAIAQAAIPELTILFPFVTKTVSSPMIIAEINYHIVFAALANATYTLALISTPVVDGFYQVIENRGAGLVNVTPAGGDEINGEFTSSKPLILKPGQSVRLSSNGNTWYANGNYDRPSRLISTQEANNTFNQFTFTNIDFPDFTLDISGLYIDNSGGTAAQVAIQFSTNNGISWVNTNYNNVARRFGYSSAGGADAIFSSRGLNEAFGRIPYAQVQTGFNEQGMSTEVKFQNVSRSRATNYRYHAQHNTTGNPDVWDIIGSMYQDVATSYNAMRLYTTNGFNFTEGLVQLIKKENRLTGY